MKKNNENNIIIVIVVVFLAIWIQLLIAPNLSDAGCIVSQSSDTMNKHTCTNRTFYTER